MLRRFPLLALVLSCLAGAGATVLLFHLGLPVTWTEWIDTGSGRVAYARSVMGLQVSFEDARSDLPEMYARHVGLPQDPHWVGLRTFHSYPDYLDFAGMVSQGSGFEESSDYLCGSLGLFINVDDTNLSAEQRTDRDRLLDLRYTRECRREIFLRTMELVKATEEVEHAVDFAVDVFALEQSVREPLTVGHLPDIEEYLQRWRDDAKR